MLLPCPLKKKKKRAKLPKPHLSVFKIKFEYGAIFVNITVVL